MISAAERNLRIAASPAESVLLWAKSPAPMVAEPAASPVFMNERRVKGFFELLTRFPLLNISCYFLAALIIQAAINLLSRGERDTYRRVKCPGTDLVMATGR